MGFVTIKEQEAKHIHQKYYDDHFEVILMDRSGPWDFPPYSWAYGVSDMGSWSGLISTNGKKIIITRSSFFDLSKVKKVYEFSKSDIIEYDAGIFKIKMTLRNKINGLTKGSPLKTLCLLPGCCFIFPPIFALFMASNRLEIRPKDEFDNLEKFKRMLAGN
ncbi:MAG: hypothetical protein EBR01_12615 [Proteobacteria bacterium]|nr:hypothetical protein [Pseudomonadota bacterium]